MEIAVARREDFERVMEFYYDLIDSMQDAEFHPAWEKDIYPTRAFVRDSIENQELLFASIDGIIVGAMVLNCSGADGYGCAPWKADADGDEVAVVHALGIALQHQGQGIAKKMMTHVIELCRAAGRKAIRLDVLASNKPAQNLYPAVGFSYVGTIPLFYEDTGCADFWLYELIL